VAGGKRRVAGAAQPVIIALPVPNAPSEFGTVLCTANWSRVVACADAATRGAFARHFGHHSVQNHNTSAFSPSLSLAKLCPVHRLGGELQLLGHRSARRWGDSYSHVSSHYGVVTAKSEDRKLSIADA
jgi:hypothetical protein